jgi:hypothetical protein
VHHLYQAPTPELGHVLWFRPPASIPCLTGSTSRLTTIYSNLSLLALIHVKGVSHVNAGKLVTVQCTRGSHRFTFPLRQRVIENAVALQCVSEEPPRPIDENLFQLVPFLLIRIKPLNREAFVPNILDVSFLVVMLKVFHLLCASALLLLRPSNAAIGPTADLVIRNVDLSPDGFPRSYALTFCLCRTWSLTSFRTVLAGGTFPGPVIRGVKGDRFKLNVIDRLRDARMLRSTSIVRCNAYLLRDKY